jgi:hypothetical protein
MVQAFGLFGQFIGLVPLRLRGSDSPYVGCCSSVGSAQIDSLFGAFFSGETWADSEWLGAAAGIIRIAFYLKIPG